MSLLAAPTEFGEVVLVEGRQALAPSGSSDLVHHLDRVSFCSSLSLVPTDFAPMASLDVERKCLPLMPSGTAPAEFGMGVNIAFRQACPATRNRKRFQLFESADAIFFRVSHFKSVNA